MGVCLTFKGAAKLLSRTAALRHIPPAKYESPVPYTLTSTWCSQSFESRNSNSNGCVVDLTVVLACQLGYFDAVMKQSYIRAVLSLCSLLTLDKLFNISVPWFRSSKK